MTPPPVDDSILLTDAAQHEQDERDTTAHGERLLQAQGLVWWGASL